MRAVARLGHLRTVAETRMTSTANIWRATGKMGQDETTGLEVPLWELTHAAVPFRLGGANQGTSGTRKVTVGGVELQLATRTANLPASTSNLLDGDLIDVTSGENAGTVWRIVEGDWADQQTARRLPIVATERPEEW